MARKILVGVCLETVTMKHMVHGLVSCLKVTFSSISDFLKRFSVFEGGLREHGAFFNADIDLEEMYMFEKGLFPFCEVSLEGNSVVCKDDISLLDYSIPDLKLLKLKINYDRASKIKSLECNGILIEDDVIETFISLYNKLDPDVLIINKQQERLLSLFEACAGRVSLNRYGNDHFTSSKGYSFFSYGVRYYREAPLYLKGRILINSGSFMDESFTVYSLIEGARICRMRLQKTASHSVGRTVTNLLTYYAYSLGYLVPFRVGVYERFKSFGDLVECDRGALTLEPYVGMHSDVCELDFVSMYPSIISKYNLSPETLYCKCCSDSKIAGTPYWFCSKLKGIVPLVCDFLLYRRLEFKKRDDFVSSSKVDYIKWLLVVIFGFQAYKNKKIGCIEVHEAINAIARKTLLEAIRVAESSGYSVVHGIVDSLYVKKKGVTEKDGINLASLISEKTGLPIDFKHLYRFITFLPSVVHPSRPVPTSYYGVAEDGKVKVRGIEMRRRTSPQIVKNLQKEIITQLDVLVRSKRFVEPSDLTELFERCIRLLRNHIEYLDHATVDDLSITVRVGKEKYKVNCPQKMLKEQLKKRGLDLKPGQKVSYVIEDAWYPKYCEVSMYKGKFDRKKYTLLLKKAFLHLFLPFGLTLEKVEDLLIGERQESLMEYAKEKVMVIAE